MAVKTKSQKTQKKCAKKRKLKFTDYKNCLKVSQLENKINCLKINSKNVEFIKNNKKYKNNNKDLGVFLLNKLIKLL